MTTPEDMPQQSSDTAPDLLREATPAPSGRWRVLAPLAGVLVVMAMVIAGVLLTSRTSPTGGVPMAGTRPDVTELTGKDVGLALGLEPTSTFEVNGCDATWAEYDDYEGFCLEGVTDDPLEERLRARQIVGWERTDALIAYVNASLELEAALDAGAGAQEQLRLTDILREKERLLHDEQRGQSTEP